MSKNIAYIDGRRYPNVRLYSTLVMILIIAIIILLVSSCPTSINASSSAPQKRMLKKPSLVQYWGQNSAGATSSGQQQPLASYCDDSTDALVIAFIDQFNIGGEPGLALPCGNNCQDIGNGKKSILNMICLHAKIHLNCIRYQGLSVQRTHHFAFTWWCIRCIWISE